MRKAKRFTRIDDKAMCVPRLPGLQEPNHQGFLALTPGLGANDCERMKKVWTPAGSALVGAVWAPIGWCVALWLGLTGCKSDPPERRAPPPEVTAARAGACAQAPSMPRDPVAKLLLPARSGGFCLDPQGGEKAYGEDADRPFDRACDELLDGECEVYRAFGALRTMEARYIDDAGSPATLAVHLTKFNTSEGAFAMFTLRVVGDGDPAGEAAPRPIAASFAAAVGVNNAYVVRGPFLAEIVFTDETAGSVAALRDAADRLVTPLAREIGEKLPGDTAPLPAAAVLPTAARLPLGVRFHTGDMFGIAGAGPGAVGYYREGDKRYRAVVLLRPDADQAKDLLATFARQQGASREKAPYDGYVRIVVQAPGDLPAEWVLGRARGVVLGVGDEVRVVRDTTTSPERARVLLSTREKMAKVKEMLAATQK